MPPFLHLRIVTKELTERSSVARSYLADQSMKAANSSGVSKLYSPNIQYYIDVSMTIIGTLLCIVTTVITTMDVVDKLRNGNI